MVFSCQMYCKKLECRILHFLKTICVKLAYRKLAAIMQGLWCFCAWLHGFLLVQMKRFSVIFRSLKLQVHPSMQLYGIFSLVKWSVTRYKNHLLGLGVCSNPTTNNKIYCIYEIYANTQQHIFFFKCTHITKTAIIFSHIGQYLNFFEKLTLTWDINPRKCNVVTEPVLRWVYRRCPVCHQQMVVTDWDAHVCHTVWSHTGWEYVSEQPLDCASVRFWWL